jgi:hypothetical protein
VVPGVSDIEYRSRVITTVSPTPQIEFRNLSSEQLVFNYAVWVLGIDSPATATATVYGNSTSGPLRLVFSEAGRAASPIERVVVTLQEVENEQGTWKDAQTGLMWTQQDNGSDVNWNQAIDYCRNLSLKGYSNWRLPTIYELAAIYDKTQNVDGLHIKGGIRLSGTWSWSDTAANSTEAWYFTFLSGERKSLPLSIKRRGRALCVRHSGE